MYVFVWRRVQWNNEAPSLMAIVNYEYNIKQVLL